MSIATPAGGMLGATLVLTVEPSWGWGALSCCAASARSSLLFTSGYSCENRPPIISAAGTNRPRSGLCRSFPDRAKCRSSPTAAQHLRKQTARPAMRSAPRLRACSTRNFCGSTSGRACRSFPRVGRLRDDRMENADPDDDGAGIGYCNAGFGPGVHHRLRRGPTGASGGSNIVAVLFGRGRRFGDRDYLCHDGRWRRPAAENRTRCRLGIPCGSDRSGLAVHSRCLDIGSPHSSTSPVSARGRLGAGPGT